MIWVMEMICGRCYGVGGKLLEAARNFHQVIMASVQVGREESEWFHRKIGRSAAGVDQTTRAAKFVYGWGGEEGTCGISDRGTGMKSVWS